MAAKNMPTIESLREAHRFPCRYTFKAFGPATDAFADAIRDGITGANEGRPPARLAPRASSGGKWTCITAIVAVDTPELVQAIYTELLEVDGLRMLL